MPDTTTFTVIAQSDVRDNGTTFGPFGSREAAEECVIALAARDNIKSATIQEIK